jgi:glycyl-tRNA synthetase beta chain
LEIPADRFDPADLFGANSSDLIEFFADRLAVYLRDTGGFKPEVFTAAYKRNPGSLMFKRIFRLGDALTDFLNTEDGVNLLAGYRRASNILKAEEKKGALPTGPAIHLAGAPEEETALLEALAVIQPQVLTALDTELYVQAMNELAKLRAPVDAFFDKVFVNDPNSALRDNRLRLLASVRATMEQVADFNLING